MKIQKLSFLVLLISSTAFSQSPQTNQPVPATMVQFLAEIEALQPLMVSDKEFKATKNEFNIQTHLNNLADFSKQLKHEKRLSTPFFKVMTEILPEHLNEVRTSFREGRKDYAHNMLNATLDGCSSCHSQVKGKNIHIWNFSPDTIKGTSFEKAEFLFAVRQYDEALPLYRDVVQKFKPTTAEPINQDVQDSLFKKQTIFVRAKRDLAGAQKEIEKDIGKPELPEMIKMLLRANLDSVQEMQKIKVPDVKTAKSGDMENFAATTLAKSAGSGWTSNRNAIPQMFVSNVLYDFVQKRDPKDIGPGIYYWLAKCEKKTSYNYFFPLAEYYLKECINRYPLSNEAKLCYSDLENLVMDNTSGERGH